MSKLISKIVVPDSNEATGYSLYNVKDSGAIHSSDVGVAGGVASLDNAGKVPSSQLPSYVDDVVEGYYHENKFYTTYTPGQEEEDPGTYSGEITAETGKIYVDIPTNQSYRWSGSAYIVISSPYVLPTASANTLGGVKVGDNLSIDQNGVLSAAAAANEVQIGGETPSSSSDVEIFIDTTEDAIAEVYTKQQQDGKFVVIKDLNAAPTESTLTYTENGTVKNFKQGDEVRVPDAEADNGYTFYKLYALTTEEGVTTATWDELGAGGGDMSDYFEKAVISLSQVGGDNEDIIGATITVLNNDNNTIINTYSWQGSPITCVISPNINYSITLSNIEGYFASPSKSYTSEWNNRREITCYYNTDLGVYIEATDGTLYNKLNWDSNKTPNSIVLLTTSHKLRISLPEHHLGKAVDDIGTHPIEQYCTCITDPTVVKQDFNGLSNTEAILRFNNAYGKTTEDFAAPYCYNFSFAYQPSGKHSYMPAGGQIYLMRQNVTAINECLTACDKNNVTTNWYRSSTVYGNTGWASQDRATWFVSLLQSTEFSYYGSLSNGYPVIPVCDY